MSNFSKALITLEYNKVLKMLADCARTQGAKELALALEPTDDELQVKLLLEQTTAAKNMSATNGAPSFGGISDVTPCAERAEKGAMLSPKELLDVSDLLYTVSRLISYSDIKNSASGCLAEIFSRLLPNNRLESEIKRIIISEDMIADDASSKLYDIRRSMKQATSRVRDLLQHYITSEAYSKCLQDNIITMRNGRYVIPVKTEHKNEIKGLVHDTSSSGATLFIEPIAVVEQNNVLKELETAEQKEIERILYSLSSDVANFAEQIKLDYMNVTELAFIFARSELSWHMKAVEPIVSTNQTVKLMGARHPLLNVEKIVPIDIELGKDFDSLIITGPNTGGKTVSLKTLGLLTLMAQSGLHIPARDASTLRIFSSVHADIGDEQSIEQSLSTFSAHMTNIVRILKAADDRSLVLFDELGAGTDPVEGAALAVAIIENVRKTGAWCAATTHYAEMKVYALETAGVCNGACEFDLSTLAPTYRLIIGAPGKSNAFAISRRLGMSEDVINRASQLIDGDNKRFENVIEKLEQNRIEAEKNRAATQKMRDEYEKKLALAEKELAAKTAEMELQKAKSYESAQRILESARITSDYVMAELDRAKKAKDSKEFAQTLDEARANIRRSIKEGSSKVNVVDEKTDENYVLPRELRKGDEVILINVDRKGTLVENPNAKGNVRVQTGLITTQTNIKNLKLCEDAETVAIEFASSSQRNVKSSIAKDFKPEIDLRGMNGEEAWFVVDRYLDDAILIGMHTVRLVHGKGTGALRRALWLALKADKRIASYRIGAYGEGDSGVTVVELK